MPVGRLFKFCDRDRRGTTVARPDEGGSWSGNHCVCNVSLPRTASDGINVAVGCLSLMFFDGVHTCGAARARKHYAGAHFASGEGRAAVWAYVY